jgi:hypothetical protein
MVTMGLSAISPQLASRKCELVSQETICIRWIALVGIYAIPIVALLHRIFM